MNTLQAIVLGIIQGLTEFLPISSSGHLVVAEHFFGIQKTTLFFEVLIHVATLIAVLIYFRKEILRLRLRDYFLLGIGTIPAVIFTLVFKKFIEQAFTSIWEVVIEYSITGVLLLYAHQKLKKMPPTEKKEVDLKKITPKQSFIIGVWQAFAILPAISRSGATVTGSLLLGLDRETAFTFSFLLSIPAILGATVLELSDLAQFQSLTQTDLLNYSLAFIFSMVLGLVSLQWFHQVIKKTHLSWFAYYCFALSAFLALLLLFVQ